MATNKPLDLTEWSNAPTAWSLAETALTHLHRVLLWGPPGIGKSHLAVRSGRSPVSVSLSSDLSVQELMGHYVPAKTDWQWHDGPVCQAFREGRFLVLNEIGRASGAVQDFLLGILDSPDVASIALPSGEMLYPKAGFKVIGTSNAPPQDLDPALRSRFEAEVHLAAPHPGLVRRLEHVCTGLGLALQDSFSDPARALDSRRVQSFSRLIHAGVAPRPAAALAFGERAPDVLAALSARGVDMTRPAASSGVAQHSLSKTSRKQRRMP